MRPKLRIKPVTYHPRYRYTIGGLKVNGKRKRLFFETQQEAEDELRRLKIKAQTQGEAGLSIPDELRVAALECTKLLAPHRKTIYDATKFFLQYLQSEQSEACSVLLERYVRQKTRTSLSPRHLYDIEKRLETFGEAFGASPIESITTAQVEDWLYTLGEGEFASRTLINWRATVHAFFEDLFRKRILAANPVSAIQKPKHVGTNPLVFTPGELVSLFSSATGPLRACLVIQAFAGLRTAEVLRLCWDDVRQAEKLIHINARIAKASKRRLVKILPNLGAWLRPYAKMKGPIWPNGFRSYHDDIADLCSALKVTWKHNGLRHSYGSYHLAKFQNADQLAEEMGHISGRMVRDYYREVVTPQSAEAYWLIAPKAEAGNVVAMAS